MTRQALTGVAYFVGGVDLSNQSNRIDVETQVAQINCTTFGSGGAAEYIGGLETVTISGGGPLETGTAYDVEREAYDGKRLILPHTIGPSNSGSAVAAKAHITKALRTTQKFYGNIGDAQSWEVQAQGSSSLASGAFLVSPATAVSSTANGTAVQVGAIADGKVGYASIHVLAATGSPALDVIVASDDASNFLSGTTRFTFSQKTAAGQYEVLTLAGPVTDDWWRAGMTFGGTGSLTIVVAFGISLFAL